MCKKLKQRLSGLSKLRRIMCKSSKSMVIQGTFQSVLCYCLPLFGGCSKTELNSLQTLQNGAARIALNLPSRSNRDEMFDTLYWLTVRQLIAFHTLLTIFRIRTTGQPEYLANILLHENRRGKIIIKNSQLELYRRSFSYRGSVLWNKLPESLRNDDKEETFKKNLSKWIRENISRFDE